MYMPSFRDNIINETISHIKEIVCVVYTTLFLLLVGWFGYTIFIIESDIETKIGTEIALLLVVNSLPNLNKFNDYVVLDPHIILKTLRSTLLLIISVDLIDDCNLIYIANDDGLSHYVLCK